MSLAAALIIIGRITDDTPCYSKFSLISPVNISEVDLFHSLASEILGSLKPGESLRIISSTISNLAYDVTDLAPCPDGKSFSKFENNTFSFEA